jgi:hypothetical protein
VLDIFLHLPKTAGTSLREFVQRQYAPEAFFPCYGGELELTSANGQFIRRLRERPNESRAVYGHFSFGVHQLFQLGRCRYFTLLRDPVERVVSFFEHQKRDPDSRLHADIAAGMTLDDVLTSHAAPEVNNHTVRALSVDIARFLSMDAIGQLVCGEYDASEPFDQVLGPFHLARAIHNIETSFAFVGICERYDYSMERLALGMGWRLEPASRLNVNPGRRPELNAKTRALIERHNDLDQQLYDRYKEGLFESFDGELVGARTTPQRDGDRRLVEREAKRLRKVLDKEREHGEALERRICDLQAACDASQAELCSRDAQINALNERIRSLDDRVAQERRARELLFEALASQKERALSLERELTAGEQRSCALEAQIAAERAELRAQVDQLRALMRSLEWSHGRAGHRVVEQVYEHLDRHPQLVKVLGGTIRRLLNGGPRPE